MQVTNELIENLANLSRLSFTGPEKEEIKKDLEKMIHFVDKLSELDTSGVEPLLHVTEVMNVYREDVVKESMPKAEALQNAPGSDENYFKVPKVIRK